MHIYRGTSAAYRVYNPQYGFGYINEILTDPIFYLLNGDYRVKGFGHPHPEYLGIWN